MKQEIVRAIFCAIDELNQMQAPDQRIDKSLDTVLSGPNAVLDSLGLVNLVIETEQKIEETFGVPVNLADQRAMSAGRNPLDTIGSLAEYIESLLSLERRSMSDENLFNHF